MIGPVLPPEQITSRDQRFECVPYSTTMLALGCVQRQAITRAGKKRLEWEKCLNCDLGRTIEVNSGGAMVMTAHPNEKKRGGWSQNVAMRTGKKRGLPIIRQVDVADDPDEPTIPTLGGSLRDPADVEADEQELEVAETHDTDPAPPPAPLPKQSKPKEKPMSATNEDKRSRQNEWQKVYSLRKKLKAAGVDLPPKGTPIEKLEALLRQSGAGNGQSSTNGKARSVSVGNGVRIVRPRRGGAPPKRKAVAPPASTSLAGELARAVEAVELLDRIGWGRARAFAAMLDEVRSS